MKQIDKIYHHKIEEKIYKLWEKSGYFNPDKLEKIKKTKDNFIIYMPLPNVTGTLHMGHTLNNTLQDILIRFYRLKNKRTLWLPGTDHAGIATQYVVEKELKKEGLTRFILGREKFIERVWQWKNKYGNIIIDQLKKLGCSADWSRSRFTMDKTYSRDVIKAFIEYYKKGWLYQGKKTINWCPRCQTSLSDLELEYDEERTFLYYIKYGPLTATTVRPETKFGDVALAVNPSDGRYQKFIGQKIKIENINYYLKDEKPQLISEELIVIADKMVDPHFGTGVVKVTPAHDLTDFEISQHHQLPLKQVIDEKGMMISALKRYENLSTFEAREKVVNDLRKLNLLVKEEPYLHRVAKCYRCGAVIEPIPSLQWFLKMEKLAQMALKALKNKQIEIIPKNFEKPYLAWLKNIRDWTVSRQIWWGHQLPVWFCQKEKEKFVVKEKIPKKCPFCKNCQMKRSEEVLDTWFSSALWPFAGLKKQDLKKYYPGQVLITARDILNLWVARMVFSGLFFKKQVPFKKIFINGTILTKEGKRMSKSKGTGIDPLNYIEQYGADATRFAIVWQATGQDIKWDENVIISGRKFTNKIWNAFRFVFYQLIHYQIKNLNTNQKPKPKTLADRKILKELEKTKKQTEIYLQKFEFSKALKNIYDFFWHKYCDFYLEKAKKQLLDLKTQKSTLQILVFGLFESIKILHPFLPFITEAIYQNLPLKNKKLLMIEKW